MLAQWIVLTLTYTLTCCDNKELVLLTKTHSTALQKYIRFTNAAVLHFKVPEDTLFVSFQFEVEEIQKSWLKCPTRDITLYLKYGSPPVINPDGSKFPKGFLLESRPTMHHIEFQSDKTRQYINITSPHFGSYFIAAFISYSNPKQAGITQQGLKPDCQASLQAEVHVQLKPVIIVTMADQDVHVILNSNQTRLYKFKIPEIADSAVLSLKDIRFCNGCASLHVKLEPYTVPKPNGSLYDVQLKEEQAKEDFHLRFMVYENTWYYMMLNFNQSKEISGNSSSVSQFIFQINYFSTYTATVNETVKLRTKLITEEDVKLLNVSKAAVHYKQLLIRDYSSENFGLNNVYRQYTLMRDTLPELYTFSFDLPPLKNGSRQITIDVSNNETIMLQFELNNGLDIGGTLQFDLAFKPRLKSVGKFLVLEDEPSEHVLIGCVAMDVKEIPTWPDKCVYNDKSKKAPVVIKGADEEINTVFIPYPEAGTWYVSFKLFCGKQKSSNCSTNCKKLYDICETECQSKCKHNNTCEECLEKCEEKVVEKDDCSNCECSGFCQRASGTCTSSVVFEIASFPCVGGKCSQTGNCVYMISEGLAYSSCYCLYGYKGWDCSDDSDANPSWKVLLEWLLLVLSNVPFLPATYVAYKRGYYVEAIVFFSTCFFSSFYHACDAGENLYRFCIAPLAALQFSDFFSGLFSIWVTIIAMAYLPRPWAHNCHIVGAILLAFFTTINKTALWVFILPFVTGIVIMLASWYWRYKKSGKLFPTKEYLYYRFIPGLVTVTTGLLVYSLLQTNSNYMYLHSFWHAMMAITVIFLIPNLNIFLPPYFQQSALSHPIDSNMITRSPLSWLNLKTMWSSLFCCQKPK